MNAKNENNTYLFFTCQIYVIFVMMEGVIQRIQLYFFWVYCKLLQKEQLFQENSCYLPRDITDFFFCKQFFFNNSEMKCFIQIIIVTYLANCNSHHIIIISYLHFPCCFIKTRCENAFSHPECTASPKWVRQPFLKKYCKNYQSLTIILPD